MTILPDQPRIVLNDERSIPQIGLGVWQTPADATAQAVSAALQTGYRHVDTAAVYGNEQGVGEGVRRSGVSRGDVFVTTKIWNSAQGFDSTLRACETSLKKLQFSAVDLLLIHWPDPRRNLFVDTWRALIRLRDEGKAISIGVSNFNGDHLDRIIGETGVTPTLNQIELHPNFQQRALVAANAERGVKTQSWSPLGRGALFQDPTIVALAEKLGRTPAQVITRWHIEHDFIVIPKSADPGRIASNFQVFDFEFEAADMAAIDALDLTDGRRGPDPLTANF